MSIELAQKLSEDLGGTIEEIGALPDGSGFAVMSMPLPANHWLTAEGTGPYGYNEPPMPFRVGCDKTITVALTREEFAEKIREAGKYAARCATMNGKEDDFDPDALLSNLVVGMLGYWTQDGNSHI